MAACGDLLTNQDLSNAKKDATTLSDMVESNSQTITSKDGKIIRTLQGINNDAQDAINSFKIKSKGQYLPDPVALDDAFEYVVFGDKTYFAVSPPYTTDPATYPDPANDTVNLVEQSYLTRGQAEIIATAGDEYITGGKIWPVNPQVSAQIGDNGLVDISFLRDSATEKLYKTSEPVSGQITALDFTLGTATVGASSVTLTEWNAEIVANAGDSLVSGGLIFPTSNDSASNVAPFNEVPPGTVYLKDTANSRVLKILPQTSGTITAIDFTSGTATIGGVSVLLSEAGKRITETIDDLSPAVEMIDVCGRTYTLRGITALPDGIGFDSGVITLTKDFITYELPVRSRTYQYIHLCQMMHEKGTDASDYVDAASSAGFIVDIDGWELVLDQGYELSTVIHGRGVIKQVDGDDGIIVNTGGGFDHFVTIDGDLGGGNRADKKRPVRFNIGAVKPFAHDLTIKNYHSATFINALMIDNDSVTDFEVKRLTVDNIKADANGVIGDADGVCRGINMTSRGADPTTVSNGTIDGFIGRDFEEWEDCDGIAIQAFVGGNTVFADVTINNVYTRNVLKRAVKVQANEVSVSRVDARSDNIKAMFAVVDFQASGGKATNIRGRGAINSGVTILGYAKVDDVQIFSSSTFEPGAALLILGGGCDASSIVGNGMESVVSVRSVRDPVSTVSLSKISGSSHGIPLWIRPANSNRIDYVRYTDVDVTCTTAGLYGLDIDTSGVGDIGQIVIDGDFSIFNDHFFNAFLQRQERVDLKSARFLGDSVGGLKVINGEAYISDVSSNKTLTVELETTTSAFVNGVEGTLRVRDTTNTDAALYQVIDEVGTNTNLRKLSW